MTRPEDIYPAISEAYNAGDLETLVSLYDPQAVFVIKPGRVTKSPAELRGAMQHLVALRGRLSVNPRTFIRSDRSGARPRDLYGCGFFSLKIWTLLT